MNTAGKKKDLALYRLQQAGESLDEAKYLFDGHKSPRSVNVDLAVARKRTEELYDLNFGVADAAHIAFEEQCGAEFISCDDSLIKKCSRYNIKIWCGNTVAFCEKKGLK